MDNILGRFCKVHGLRVLDECPSCVRDARNGKADNVNHPPHYNSGKAQCECGRKIECIDVTRHMSFNVGNAIKYVWRFEHKNGVEDLKKAIWYLQDQVKKLESEKTHLA